jgi:hypothetical protein
VATLNFSSRLIADIRRSRGPTVRPQKGAARLDGKAGLQSVGSVKTNIRSGHAQYKILMEV